MTFLSIKQIPFAFAVTVAIFSSSASVAVASVPDARQKSLQKASDAYQQSGVARDGSDLHVWLNTRVAGVEPGTPITYLIGEKYTPGKNRDEFFNIIREEVLKSAANNSSKADDHHDRMTPGDHLAARVGDSSDMHLACMNLRSDGTPATAQAALTWIYQFRDDSNQDGSNDSNPAWVLTSANFINVTVGDQTTC